jgi:hypothetical protein
MLPITQCDIAHRDIGNEKNLKTYKQFNHGDIHTYIPLLLHSEINKKNSK